MLRAINRWCGMYRFGCFTEEARPVMTMRTLAISLFVSLTFVATAQETNFTAADYWQLNKARLELAALEWQERIASAEQANGDRKALMSRSAAITKEYAGYHRKLHAKFATSPQAYVRYATDHAREIESYL